MVRGVRRLLAAAVGALVLLLPAATAAGAQAAPKPAPAGVDITGPGLDQPLRLRAENHQAHVIAVIDQVSWLRRSNQTTSAPKADRLGPKYIVVVLAGDSAKQAYDLYPLAEGGPRAYRPARQPDGQRVRAAWFLGRLNMSETLRTAGVPLARQADTISGGVGGGERVIPAEALDPGQDINEALGELRHLLLLNAGVVVVITLGLAGIALLVRHRTR